MSPVPLSWLSEIRPERDKERRLFALEEDAFLMIVVFLSLAAVGLLQMAWGDRVGIMGGEERLKVVQHATACVQLNACHSSFTIQFLSSIPLRCCCCQQAVGNVMLSSSIAQVETEKEIEVYRN